MVEEARHGRRPGAPSRNGDPMFVEKRFDKLRSALWLGFAAGSGLPLLAHEGEPPAPHDLVTAFEFDPLTVGALVLSAWLYWRGAARRRGFRRWETASFRAGWGTLAVALVSPVHRLGEALFAAHMLQHELLMLVAAPLLVLGRPLVAFAWAAPYQIRPAAFHFTRLPRVSVAWHFLTNPFHAWVIHFAALWLWHIPQLFDASVESPAVHALQHASFLGSALLFWWALLRGHAARRQYGAGVLYVFSTALHSGILGALLTFSARPWYSVYRDTTAAWGVSPLEDQQLGGLIMWAPPALVYIAAGLALLALWLRDSEFRRQLLTE
jgi:putative membrane protein